VFQALAIYRTLSSEPPVSSSEAEVETEHAELDSGKESTYSVEYDSHKYKTEQAGENTVTKSIDGV